MVGSVLRVRYELIQLLDEGPIFACYAARDRLQGSEICIRVIRPPFAGEAPFLQKLREIVQRYATVQHPGVESMLEVDEDEGNPFLISELTKGTSIAERIRKLAPFSVPVAVSTAISLCEGPIAAGVVLTSMAPYLAPEISAGGMPSPASDVYSSGVLLYELLTGRLPYNADTPVSMALKHATGGVPSVRMFNPAVPSVLEEIVKKALSKEPYGRYASAGALLSDLRVLQDALRFGRTLNWPLTPETMTPQVNSMPKTTASRIEPIAKKKVKVERDVPLVLWFLIAIFGAPAAMLLGIYIWFSLSRPNPTKVPSLGGLTIEEARQMVKPEKLIVDVDSHRASEKVPEEHIISSDPPSGVPVREGSHVRVILSSGSQRVAVPDLVGKSPDDAKIAIEGAHLQLDENIGSDHSKKIPSGMVMSEEPKAGTKVDPSSKVKIVVSTGDDGSGDGNANTPPLAGGETNTYTIKVKLTNLTKPVTLRIDIVDDKGTRSVYEAEHEPEETVELATRGTGKQIKFRIYYDNQLVREIPLKAEQGTPVAPSIQDNNEQ